MPALALQKNISTTTGDDKSPNLNISETNVVEVKRVSSYERTESLTIATSVAKSKNNLLQGAAKKQKKAILFASKVQPYTTTIIDSSEQTLNNILRQIDSRGPKNNRRKLTTTITKTSSM